MKTSPLFLAAVSLVLLGSSPGAASAQTEEPLPRPEPLRVLLTTDLGEIEVELDSAAAPITVANFLRYVDAGLYDGGSFYRTVHPDNQPQDSVKIEVIQGGMNRSRQEESYPPIQLEGTGETGLEHRDGTISMARSGPDTGRAEFFICIGPQPELDTGGARNPDGFGFAAFGQVVRGMAVVRQIQARDADQRQRLFNPVQILGARRLRGR